MPRETFEFRLAYRKLLLGLLVTVVPVSLVALYAISQSAKSLEQAIGSHYAALAEATATEVQQFIHSRLIDVGLMAADPAVIDAVIASNQTLQEMSDSAFQERIQEVEKTWPTSRSDPLLKQILSSKASQNLRRYLRLDPRFLRITVTDRRGVTVAATHKTLDYYQADEDYWQNIYAEGRGSVSLTDIEYDEITKHNYIGIGVPIVDEESGQLIGTLDALVEVSSLFPVVQRTEMGTEGRVLLVKGDGTIISGPKTNLAMNIKSEDYTAVLDAMQSLEGWRMRYVITTFRDRGETLIAFADTGLEQDFQNLEWMVLVSRPTEQAFAPVWTAQRPIMLISLLGLAAVVFLAVYFSLHRKREAEELKQLLEEQTVEKEQS